MGNNIPKLRWLAWLAVLLVAGCSAPERPVPPSRAVTAANPVFATELAGPTTFLAPMPTAVVILKPDSLDRNRAFCSVMMRRLPTAQQARAASVVAPNLVLTRWLVQLPEIPAAKAHDCDYLVATYDYARAARLIRAVHLTEGRFTGRGPFLVMVIPDATGLHVAGVDGSNATEAQFGAFLDSWSAALQRTNALVTRTPDQPGILRSIVNLITAIFRGVAGVTGGIIRGVITALRIIPA